MNTLLIKLLLKTQSRDKPFIGFTENPIVKIFISDEEDEMFTVAWPSLPFFV
jgi:hypothetical protein